MTNGWGECFCDDYECPRCGVPPYGGQDRAYESPTPAPVKKFEQLKFPDDDKEMMFRLVSLGCDEDFLISCHEFYKRKGFLSSKQASVLRKICLNYLTDGERVYLR